MTKATILCLIFLFLNPLASASDDAQTLDRLYTHPGETVRAPASAPSADEFAKDFGVIAPERSPASAKPISKAKSPSRRSRLPSSVADGFELRVQYKKLTSTFWVVRRDSHHDLLFANSSGSRSSVGLTADDFHRLYSVANSFKPRESDTRKCKESIMQMHVVTSGQNEKTVTLCANEKSKDAEGLRTLSQALAVAVR